MPVKNSGVHTLQVDRQGTLWMTLQLSDMVVSFDPKTAHFRVYKGFRKGSLIHSFAYDPFGYIQYDAHGRIWMSEFGGNAVASLEPKSGQIKEYDTAASAHCLSAPWFHLHEVAEHPVAHVVRDTLFLDTEILDQKRDPGRRRRRRACNRRRGSRPQALGRWPEPATSTRIAARSAACCPRMALGAEYRDRDN